MWSAFFYAVNITGNIEISILLKKPKWLKSEKINDISNNIESTTKADHILEI